MKKYLLISSLILSYECFSQDCEVKDGLDGLKKTDCMQSFSKDELEYEFSSQTIQDYCKKCKNPLVDNIKEQTDLYKKNKSTSYGNATLDEFQKELTSLTVDLLKVRSSYTLKFDPSKTTKNCNFDKNLIKPSCLAGKDETDFNSRLKSIKGSLATELSIMISGNMSSNKGLYIHKSKDKCDISDSSMLFAKMRYTESLLTPGLITKLKSLKTPKHMSLEEHAKRLKDIDFDISLRNLKTNPLILPILSSPKELEKFLALIKATDSNANIIEKLYESSDLETAITNRCTDLFTKTSIHLENTFCPKDKNYIADDIDSLEIISGNHFKDISDDLEAKHEMSKHCQIINIPSENVISFKKIREDINLSSPAHVVNKPLKNYQEDAYQSLFAQPSSLLCRARNSNECRSDATSEVCQMLKFIDLSKSDKVYKQMASASSDNVNLILRSLVSDGLPQTSEGKPDIQAITLLKNEGILDPGTTPVPSRSKQQDVATFHKSTKAEKLLPASDISKSQQAAVAQTPQSEAPQNPIPAPISESFNIDSSSSRSTATTSKKTKVGLNEEGLNKLAGKMRFKTKPAPISRNIAGAPNSAAQARSDADQDMASDSPTTSTMAASAGTAAAAPQAPTPSPMAFRPATSPSATSESRLDQKKREMSSRDKTLAEGVAARAAASTAPDSPATASVAQAASADGKPQAQAASSTPTIRIDQKKLELILNAKPQELTVTSKEENFVVKIKNYEITVVLNKQKQEYEVVCGDKTIPNFYLQEIARYFNGSLKEKSGKRDELLKTLAGP